MPGHAGDPGTAPPVPARYARLPVSRDDRDERCVTVDLQYTHIDYERLIAGPGAFVTVRRSAKSGRPAPGTEPLPSGQMRIAGLLCGFPRASRLEGSRISTPCGHVGVPPRPGHTWDARAVNRPRIHHLSPNAGRQPAGGDVPGRRIPEIKATPETSATRPRFTQQPAAGPGASSPPRIRSTTEPLSALPSSSTGKTQTGEPGRGGWRAFTVAGERIRGVRRFSRGCVLRFARCARRSPRPRPRRPARLPR